MAVKRWCVCVGVCVCARARSWTCVYRTAVLKSVAKVKCSTLQLYWNVDSNQSVLQRRLIYSICVQNVTCCMYACYVLQSSGEWMRRLYVVECWVVAVVVLKCCCTLLGGYSADHEVIVMFWRVIESFTDTQRRQLLKFVTSCSRPPLLGFKVSRLLYCWT